MKNSQVSIDLAKNVFQVCAMDDDQKIVFNKNDHNDAIAIAEVSR